MFAVVALSERHCGAGAGAADLRAMSSLCLLLVSQGLCALRSGKAHHIEPTVWDFVLCFPLRWWGMGMVLERVKEREREPYWGKI